MSAPRLVVLASARRATNASTSVAATVVVSAKASTVRTYATIWRAPAVREALTEIAKLRQHMSRAGSGNPVARPRDAAAGVR
jgi:hypothetical protein